MIKSNFIIAQQQSFLNKMLMKKNKGKKKQNKSKGKRQGTFNSSEFSLLEDRIHSSACDLFRNEAIKRKNQIIMNSSMQKKTKIQKQLNTTKKKGKSKSKGKLAKCQIYEMVPYKNSLNSQIVFSNEETKRDDRHSDSENSIAIKVNENFLVDSNKMLRYNIKKEYQRKMQAAVKIQKIFRGYLTRKILQKYVYNQQKILSQRLMSYKSDEISEHSSYFAQKQNRQSIKKLIPQNSQINANPNIHQNDHQDSQQEQQLQHVVYRHHQPIYSHNQISGYLQSSEDEDFQQDAFDHNIIFETNEEYIESRKSSLQQQQPKNKLSKTGTQPQPIKQDPAKESISNEGNLVQSPKQQISEAFSSDLVKTEKKQDKDRIKMNSNEKQIKQQTIKITEQSQNNNLQVQQFLETIPYQINTNQSDKKFAKKKIEEIDYVQKLKQAEVSKWQEIINMVSTQINRNIQNNNQMSNFMKQIMQISLKNKHILEENDLNQNKNKAQVNNTSSISSEVSLQRQDSLSKHKIIKTNRNYLANLEIFDFDESQISKDSKEKQSIKHYLHPSNFTGQRSSQQKSRVFINQKVLFSQLEIDKNNKSLTKQNLKNIQKFNDQLNPLSPISSFQHTGQIKKFLLGNIQDDHIEQMLILRQKLLRKRQSEEIKKINQQLQNGFISQQYFDKKIERLSEKFNQQKSYIEKARQDISKGYRAAIKLTKQAFFDAKKLGYKLPISRSMQGLKFRTPLVFNDIIIDEMVNFKKQTEKPNFNHIRSKAMFENSNDEEYKLDSLSEKDSSQLQFTEQELSRFRRAQPYDIEIAQEIADLNRNVLISEELLRQQQDDQNEKSHLMKTNKHIFRQIYQIQEAEIMHKNNPQVELLTEKIIEFLLWQFSGDLLIKPVFSERLLNKSHFYKPKLVQPTQRRLFISLLQKHLPECSILTSKLNQKICPLPSQLLKCMRIDFSEEEDEQNSYQQIGKYQFIINQEVCNHAITQFKDHIQKNNPEYKSYDLQIQELKKQFQLGEKTINYLKQREKFITNRKCHTRQLRWEVLNIEIHCIFDAWNEELIFLRSQKAGYSGIGLNELTLSVKDHNNQISEVNTLSVINQGKVRLLKNLEAVESNHINDDQEDLLENDAKWIFYADQALSYGLQLVYLIEEDIFGQFTKQFRKKFILGRYL